MKVTAVLPGYTYVSDPRKNLWGFTIILRRGHKQHVSSYQDEAPSASGAKQKMREQLVQLRKKHCVN